MSNLKWSIMAKVIRRLDQLAVKYSVNKRVSVSSRVAGYKVLVLDIAILNKNEEVMIGLYIGPKKQRRMIKYKMLRYPVYYFHTEDITNRFEKMIGEYVDRLG